MRQSTPASAIARPRSGALTSAAATRPPAGGLNLAIGAVAIAVDCLCLAIASRASSPFVVVAAAIVFGLSNSTVFSLMHEAVHSLLHGDRRLNDWGGRLFAAFFPTSFALQRAAHLAHHRNNRSEAERFDCFGPNDNLPLKVAQWYGILTGLYWLMIPAFCLAYALAAEVASPRALLARHSRFARQTSSAAYAESLDGVPLTTFRLEVLLSTAVQATVVLAFGVTFAGWALCYGAFALAWSSLQYADHAFSPLNALDGAWNLGVPRLLQAIQLNYHLHLRHHRHPALPWRDLPRRRDADEAVAPYWRMLLVMWAGPRPTPGARVSDAALARRDRLVGFALAAVFAVAFGGIYATGDALFRRASTLHDLSTPFDAMLPMMTVAAPVYLSITPLLMLAPFLLRKANDLLPVAIAWLAELVVALAIFAAFPTAAIGASYSSAGVFGRAMALADAINLDGNNFPSLHVALAVSAVTAYAPFVARRSRIALVVWGAAIVVSTMLTRQHGLADVLGGLALAGAGMGLVDPWARRELAASERMILNEASPERR